MYTPEVTQKLAEWRRKVMDNTITREEMQQAVIILREGRKAAADQKTKTVKAKKPTKSADELLSEL